MRSAIIIVAALLAGILLGGALGVAAPDFARASVGYVEPIGGLWLNALQMTIIPLIISLLITGIADASDASRAGAIAARSVAAFMVILWCSAILAAIAMPQILAVFPAPAEAANALRSAANVNAEAQPVPGFADFLNGLIPTNPVAAAANNAILPLIVFTSIFAFAITRLPAEQRKPFVGYFKTLSDVMLVVITWVLALAPFGVFALGYAVAVKTGFAALGGLVHYVVTVSSIGIVIWIAAYAVGLIGGRVALPLFARSAAPAQAVAISTQSSLASLPAMLKGAEAMRIPASRADVTLPLAVALFRATGPGMNMAVAIYVAHLFGVPLDGQTLAIGVAVAATTTLAAVSLPGTISFITSIAPIAVAMGVPIAPLALLVAVETLPDIFRTVGNVTMNLGVTATVNRLSGPAEE